MVEANLVVYVICWTTLFICLVTCAELYLIAEIELALAVFLFECSPGNSFSWEIKP